MIANELLHRLSANSGRERYLAQQFSGHLLLFSLQLKSQLQLRHLFSDLQFVTLILCIIVAFNIKYLLFYILYVGPRVRLHLGFTSADILSVYFLFVSFGRHYRLVW